MYIGFSSVRQAISEVKCAATLYTMRKKGEGCVAIYRALIVFRELIEMQEPSGPKSVLYRHAIDDLFKCVLLVF